MYIKMKYKNLDCVTNNQKLEGKESVSGARR